MPEQFLVSYDCELCGEEVEMSNCMLDFISIPCEECNTITRFYPVEVQRFNLEWDSVDE